MSLASPFGLGVAFACGMASTFKYVGDEFSANTGLVTGLVGLAGGLGGFLLPVLFGAILDWLGVNSSCFMFLYGIVWVSLILFQIAPGSPLDLIRGQAEQTLAQVIAAPDEFEACALTLSNCPSGRQGGNLGQIGRGVAAPEFEQALFANQWIGVLPHLVKTRYGFHVVSIDRRVEGRVLPFDVAHQRIAERLAERVQKVALRQYVRLLAGQADVKGVELDATLTPLVQ